MSPLRYAKVSDSSATISKIGVKSIALRSIPRNSALTASAGGTGVSQWGLYNCHLVCRIVGYVVLAANPMTRPPPELLKHAYPLSSLVLGKYWDCSEQELIVMTRYFDVTDLVFVTEGHWPVMRNMSH